MNKSYWLIGAGLVGTAVGGYYLFKPRMARAEARERVVRTIREAQERGPLRATMVQTRMFDPRFVAS